MQKIVTLFVVLLSFPVFGQQNKVGLSVSPNYAYRIYSSNNPNFSSPTPSEMPKWGYSVTASYERNFHKKAAFFTGISFFNNGYQTEEFDVLYSDNTPLPPNPLRAFQTRTSLYQIGIPVGANLFFPVKKIRLFLSAGASVNYLVQFKETRFFYYANGDTEKSSSNINDEFYNPFSVAAFGSFGVEFNLAENYVMRIAPHIHYSLTNIMDSKVAYRVYPSASGINFTVLRTL